MDKQVYRVTMSLSGRRKYIGVLASSEGNAKRAAIEAEINGYTFRSVALEPERPADLTGD